MNARELVTHHVADLRAPMRGAQGQVVDDRRERLADTLNTLLALADAMHEFAPILAAEHVRAGTLYARHREQVLATLAALTEPTP